MRIQPFPLHPQTRSLPMTLRRSRGEAPELLLPSCQTVAHFSHRHGETLGFHNSPRTMRCLSDPPTNCKIWVVYSPKTASKKKPNQTRHPTRVLLPAIPLATSGHRLCTAPRRVQRERATMCHLCKTLGACSPAPHLHLPDAPLHVRAAICHPCRMPAVFSVNDIFLFPILMRDTPAFEASLRSHRLPIASAMLCPFCCF